MFPLLLMTVASMPWQRVLLIPCAVLTAAALQAGSASAQASELTASQRDALFRVRRDWVLKTYPQRLALLKNAQRCLEGAAVPEAFRQCKRQNLMARRALLRQGRNVINAERQRLGLAPLAKPLQRRDGRPRHQKGRS